MSEEHRQRTIRTKLAHQQIDPNPAALPTGFPSLDSALGIGGLPRGGIVEIFGPSSSGRTTLALQIVAHLQHHGGTAAWIDAEFNFDPSVAAAAGIAVADLPVVPPESAEQALDIAATLAGSGAIDLLVVDSAAALVPRLELETGLGESGHSLLARALVSGLGKLSRALKRTGASAIFLNQIRTRTSPAGESSETTAGGPALRLHAAARIWIYQVTRSGMRFRVLKNKAAGAFTEGELAWKSGAGFVESP